MKESKSDQVINKNIASDYKFGFESNIEYEEMVAGLNEEVIRKISVKKGEPEYFLNWRLDAYHKWKKMKMPNWANLKFKKEINFDEIIYFAKPKNIDGPKSLDEVDPELIKMYDKLGVPLHEREKLAGVAVDAVIDSVSIATTFKKQLSSLGIIFCSLAEAIKEHPELVKKYIGSVVPVTDNYFSALNSAVFSDGSFCYIPKDVRCPMDLSTYFRINQAKTGQFERTLIIAEESSYVSYLEGCTAPMRDENQLHAAVVEIIALDNAEVNYSTVQNWYPGDEQGKGGVYNLVTKRGIAHNNSKISWKQIETGSAITWKYPSVILKGNNSTGEFYSVALTKHYQQADTGTKMIHLGKNTSSTIVSKGISAAHGQNTYRGLVKVGKNADHARNFTQCDSMLIGNKCGAHTFPYIESANHNSQIEHEATTSKISDEQLFYCQQRGIDPENATYAIVNGFCKDVFNKLPMEFAVEAQALIEISLEGSVG